jgi:signal transduction histidine kinase
LNLSKDGKWLFFTAAPLKNSKGEIIGAIETLQDITESKQAEEKIKHLNLVLRAIRNVNQLIVKVKDRERLLKGACENLVKTRGYHNTWIVLLDEEGKLKTYAEAGLGEAFLPMIELLKKGKLTTCSQKALKQQEVVITENPASTCPECPLAQKYSGRGAMTIRLEYNGKVYGLISVSIPTHIAVDQEEQTLFKEVAEDIAFGLYNIKMVTERKQVQQALQKSHDELELRVKERTAQLEASMYELEAFAYSVSHDLQAPLRAISGFSEILLKDYLNALDDKGQHYLQRVRAGTVNMSQMIEDLLTLSRIGRRPINKKRVDLEKLVKETYELLSEAERKDRKVDFTVKSCPPVSSDPQLLKIVLTNLLSNALKFSRKVKKTEIEFGCKTEDKKTIFYLKDNGIGFDMKYADKLFAPFQRLHKEEEYEGSGIGLATVQRIIRRHGGEIRVESLPGSGSTFYFTL